MSILRRLVLVALVVTVSALALGLSACATETPATKQAETAIQQAVLARGQVAEPPYRVQNFLSRAAINSWLERVDTPGKNWYIYLMSDAGAFIGYFIGNTIPLSYGVSLTSPIERLYGRYPDQGMLAIPAPGLDAVYYTGTDPSVHYFFDAETDALVTFNCKFVYFDMPLDIQVPRLKILLSD